MNNLKIRKLVAIDGFDSGKDGNLFVALVDKVTPTTVKDVNGKEQDVEVLICTATLKDQRIIDKFEAVVDSKTPCNRLIVVSEKFLNLNKKYQLALLELESKKVQLELNNPDNNLSALIQAEVYIIEKFGKFTEWMAVGKARRFREKSERAVATGLHSKYKQDQKQFEKLRKAGIKYGEGVDIDYREVQDDEPTITAEPAPAQ